MNKRGVFKIIVFFLVLIALFAFGLMAILVFQPNLNFTSGNSVKQGIVVVQNNSGDYEKELIYGENYRIFDNLTLPIVMSQGTGWVNEYTGGDIELDVQGDYSVNYKLFIGINCDDSKRILLGHGTLNNSFAHIPKPNFSIAYKQLCLELNNPRFIGWRNPRPFGIGIDVYEFRLKE